MNGAWHQWVIGVLGATVLVGAAIAAVPGIYRFIKAAARAPELLERVVLEFAPNGGGSMHDAINRIDDLLERRTVIFERIEAQQEQQTSAMEMQTIAFEQHLLQDEMFVDYTHARFHDLLNEHQKTLLLLALPDHKRTEIAAEMLMRHDDAEVATRQATEETK